MCALVAASNAGKMNKKRGIFGSPEADAMNNYVVETHGFNDESIAGFDSGSQYNDYSSNHNQFGSSSHSDFHPSPLESTFNDASHSSGPQSNFNSAPAHMPYESFPPNNNHHDEQSFNGGFSQGFSNSGPSFNAAPAPNYLPPSQHFDKPHESVQTRHSESTEKGRFPVEVPRTIVKTIHVEHPVPQASYS